MLSVDEYERMQNGETFEAIKREKSRQRRLQAAANQNDGESPMNDTSLPGPEMPATPKTRKKPGLHKPNRSPAPVVEDFIEITPRQASNLWHAITGGQLDLSGEMLVCKVSLSSFNKALPVLLDHLKGAS